MKFSIKQLSKYTGWEPRKLAKLLTSLKKVSSAQQDLITKLAQGVGQFGPFSSVNPGPEVEHALTRKLPERGQRRVPMTPMVQPPKNLGQIITMISNSNLPKSQEVASLYLAGMKAAPGAKDLYYRPANDIVMQYQDQYTQTLTQPVMMQLARLAGATTEVVSPGARPAVPR